MILLLLLLLCGACGKATKSDGSGSGSIAAGSGSAAGSGAAVGSGSGSGSATVVTKDASPCPEGDALKAKTATLFAVKVDKLDAVACVVGRFPKPAWLIEARYWGAEEGMLTERTAIVDPSGTIVSSVEDEVPPGAADSSGSKDHQAVDLDHDGIDEFLYVFTSDKRGILEEILYINWLKDGKFEPLFERQFDFDNGANEPENGVISCAATWAIDPPAPDGKRSITFVPTRTHKGKAEECIAKKETWALGADGKFALTPSK